MLVLGRPPQVEPPPQMAVLSSSGAVSAAAVGGGRGGVEPVPFAAVPRGGTQQMYWHMPTQHQPPPQAYLAQAHPIPAAPALYPAAPHHLFGPWPPYPGLPPLAWGFGPPAPGARCAPPVHWGGPGQLAAAWTWQYYYHAYLSSCAALMATQAAAKDFLSTARQQQAFDLPPAFWLPPSRVAASSDLELDAIIPSHTWVAEDKAEEDGVRGGTEEAEAALLFSSPSVATPAAGSPSRPASYASDVSVFLSAAESSGALLDSPQPRGGRHFGAEHDELSTHSRGGAHASRTLQSSKSFSLLLDLSEQLAPAKGPSPRHAA